MLRRSSYLSLVTLTLAISSGCAYETICDLHDGFAASYQANHYMCSQCGPTYWSEWFNDPPSCCEPCSQSGYYCGRSGCLRAYLRQRRNSLFRSLFGCDGCGCGDYGFENCGCGQQSGCNANGECNSGCPGDCGPNQCCGGGGYTTLSGCGGFGRRAVSWNRWLGYHGDDCGACGGGPGGCGCGCGPATGPVGPNEPLPSDLPTQPMQPTRPAPTPAPETLPPPPATMRQGRQRSRVYQPAAYDAAYQRMSNQSDAEDSPPASYSNARSRLAPNRSY